MLLLALLLAAAPAPDAVPSATPPPENLLQGPVRCVLRYLEAVRVAGPRAAEVHVRPTPARAADWDAARRLLAPRTLEEIARGDALDGPHPLAPWRDTSSRVLETFQLLAVRRAPLGTAVVTVRELFWHPADPGRPLARTVSEYLVARVEGAWRVVARRPGGAFEDDEVAARYAGWFDAASAPPAHGTAPGGVPR